MASLMHRSSGIESHPNFLIHCVQLERVQSTAGILLKTLCQKVFTALRSMRAAQQLGKRQSWLMWLIPGFNLSTKLPCNAVRSSCLPYPQNQLSFFCFSDLKFQEIIFPLLKKQTILIWVPQRFLVSCINWTRPKTNHSPKFSCKVISNMNRSMTTCKNYSQVINEKRSHRRRCRNHPAEIYPAFDSTLNKGFTQCRTVVAPQQVKAPRVPTFQVQSQPVTKERQNH